MQVKTFTEGVVCSKCSAEGILRSFIFVFALHDPIIYPTKQSPGFPGRNWLQGFNHNANFLNFPEISLA